VIILLIDRMRKLLCIVTAFLVPGLIFGMTGCSGSGGTAPNQSECRADFSAEPTELDGPTQVFFTDQSTGNVTGWAWDFNNNGTIDSTRQNPTYFYDGNGTYSVTLTVTGPGCENTLIREDYISVAGCRK